VLDQPDSDIAWRKSTRSGAIECVEVAFVGADTVMLRDSKYPEGPRLTYTAGEWRAFIEGVRLGEFDL
jgi:hypothetical protein